MVWTSPFSRTPLSFCSPYLGNPCEYSHQPYVCDSLSNAMDNAGQNIKPLDVSDVQRLWTNWTRLWRHLWTDLHQIWNIASPYHVLVKKIFSIVIESTKRACATIARPLIDFSYRPTSLFPCLGETVNVVMLPPREWKRSVCRVQMQQRPSVSDL